MLWDLAYLQVGAALGYYCSTKGLILLGMLITLRLSSNKWNIGNGKVVLLDDVALERNERWKKIEYFAGPRNGK